MPRTAHRLCARDIKRKLPWFPSDFYEGFHIQSISAILFIYLGCITNAITFGGLLGDATDNYQVQPRVSPAWGQQGWDGVEMMGWDGKGWFLPYLCLAKLLGMEIRCQVGLAALESLQDGTWRCQERWDTVPTTPCGPKPRFLSPVSIRGIRGDVGGTAPP